MRINLYCIIVVLFVGVTLEAYSQWSSNTTINTPICLEQREQRMPKIMPDGHGGAIIVWLDSRNFEADVFANRLDADGKRLWGAKGTPVSTMFGSEVEFDAYPDGNGGVFVTWVDNRGDNPDIYAQRLNDKGEKTWGEEGTVVCLDPIIQYLPKIVPDGAGGIIIGWSQHTLGGGSDNDDVYAQRLNANGETQWVADGVAVGATDVAQFRPSMCTDGAGGAILTWSDTRLGFRNIVAQRITADGGAAWIANGKFVSLSSPQDNPIIVSDGSGGGVIAWEDQRSGNFDLYALQVTGAGNSNWAGEVALATTPQVQKKPDMILADASSIIVVWEDTRNGNSDIYGQRINLADGSFLWGDGGKALINASANQENPRITSDGAGGCYIVWEDRRTGSAPFNLDIWCQRINADGSSAWQDDGVPLCNIQNTNQFVPVVCPGPQNSAIVAWEDYRAGTGNSNIYGTKILSDGSFPVTPAVITLAKDTLDFGSVLVASKKDMTVKITNLGGDTLKISGVTSSDPMFSAVATIVKVAPNASFDDTIRFAPTAVGDFSGMLVISANSLPATDTIYVSGKGIGQGSLEINPSPIAFGKVKMTTKKDITVTITNHGTGTTEITSIAFSDPAYVPVPNTITIPKDESRDIVVTFTPRKVGYANASMTLTGNFAGSPMPVPVSGYGQGVGVVEFSKSTIAFGTVKTGQFKDEKVVIENTGTDTLNISKIATTNPVFSVDSSGLILATGETREVTIRFRPIALGPTNGQLVVTSDGTGSPNSAAMIGVGEQGPVPVISANQTVFEFDTVRVNRSKAMVLTIRNTGDDTLRVSDITIDNTSFSVDTKVFTALPDELITDTVRFSPTVEGPLEATMSIVSNTLTSPFNITLRGNGLPALSVWNVPQPAEFTLGKNYPSPFSARTVIPYRIQEGGVVSLVVLDALGRELALLTQGRHNPGSYTVEWSAAGYPSGLYFYRLTMGKTSVTLPMLLSR